ncbi:hypothetical protein K474DRAFT_1711509 [Panus rudis PR-1116 ss-1]|nr:hypothetical protein K474DRAFT_1711509 [Panus rudis PR-1116 ss-1]
MASTTPDSTLRGGEDEGNGARRSWHDVFSPFSPSALASLPKKAFRRTPRYTRTDHVPEASQGEDGQMPTVRDYHAINSLPPRVRVPKKIATPVKVEGKVWFANERTWVSYLNIGVFMGTLSLALFNASKDDIARDFAYVYAIISAGIIIYGYYVYQKRITMIRKRDPGHFDEIAGPVIISALLFIAVLANFAIRVRELRDKEVPIPGLSYFLS